MASITLKNVTKIYRSTEKERGGLFRNKKVSEKKRDVIAVKDFSMEIEDKEFVVLLGPSGCGKSTTLRMIAGLEEIDGGELYIDDVLVNDMESKDRDVAMVFQNYALYPHMSVFDNMAFAIRKRISDKKEVERKVRENCIIPKIEKQEMKILHPDHISSYLNAAERRNALPMFYLELVSGLRKGELVALQWSDLDEANCTISVSKQASWDTEGNLILSQPKTGNSIREVSIPQDAVELLKQEHAKHPDNPWMFPSSRTGEMYHPDSVVNLHKKILKDAGLEHIRFHDLRHTFATLALQNGVDVKTVSSMLGHYDAGFTLRTYTHATRQKQDEAAQTMGSFMSENRGLGMCHDL